MNAPTFELLPIAELAEHEEVDAAAVEALVERIRKEGVVREPIWVARGSHVILNGHHRFQALKRLGASRVPAWVFDYDDPGIVLERWGPGPPLSKREVEERARSGRPYPPKTTKHVLRTPLPERRTALAELTPATAAAHRRSPDAR